jgi:hypothetical protein
MKRKFLGTKQSVELVEKREVRWCSKYVDTLRKINEPPINVP